MHQLCGAGTGPLLHVLIRPRISSVQVLNLRILILHWWIAFVTSNCVGINVNSQTMGISVVSVGKDSLH